jgi:hypothetical protein
VDNNFGGSKFLKNFDFKNFTSVFAIIAGPETLYLLRNPKINCINVYVTQHREKQLDRKTFLGQACKNVKLINIFKN